MPRSVISTQLERQLERCRSPHRHRTITARWAGTKPALAGLSIDDILTCCEAGSTDQNPIIAALIELHQAGDSDASTVLMSACAPMVGAAARKTSTGRVPAATIDTTWAALAHVLATINPDTATDPHDADEEILLRVIGLRFGRCRGRLGRGERQFNRHEHVGALPERAGHSDVEDSAIANVELDRIAAAVNHGVVPADRWQQLVARRLNANHTAPASPRERVAIHRTARQLARLVDHVAA